MEIDSVSILTVFDYEDYFMCWEKGQCYIMLSVEPEYEDDLKSDFQEVLKNYAKVYLTILN